MNLYMILNSYFPMLYSIKYFHSIRNVSSIKASFQQKSDFMSFSLKRCIQACQFSHVFLIKGLCFKGNTHK